MYTWKSLRIGRLGSRDGDLLVDGVLLGDLGEVNLLGLGGVLSGRVGKLGRRLDDDLARGSLARQESLDLAGVVASILLAESGDLVELLLGNILDLGGLGVNQVGGVLDLRIDKLLVAGVDQGNKEDDGGADDGKTPVGDELDEEVGDKGSNPSLGGPISFKKDRIVVESGLTAQEAPMFSANRMR